MHYLDTGTLNYFLLYDEARNWLIPTDAVSAVYKSGPKRDLKSFASRSFLSSWSCVSRALDASEGSIELPISYNTS